MGEPERPTRPIRWRKGNLLGRGAFASVFLGLHLETGEMMAVKEIMIGQKQSSVENVIKEVKLLSQLEHPHIVRYLGIDFQETVLNIFMEYVPGGSLESLLAKFGSFPEELTKVYAKQILLGLRYLHSRNILHRDIKGGNVLVTSDGVAKLSDFGASKQIEDLASGGDWRGTVTGTPLWMAPEVVLDMGYGIKSDIYSFGATVMEMLSGKPPNQHIRNFAALVRFWSSGEPVAIPETLSPLARDFLRSCLHIDPARRPSADDLLKHRYVCDAVDPGAGGAGSGEVVGAPLVNGEGSETQVIPAVEEPAPTEPEPPAAHEPEPEEDDHAHDHEIDVGLTGVRHIINELGVLIADPDPEGNRRTAAIFSDFGCPLVLNVENEAEAMEVLKGPEAHKIKLVCVDDHFPPMKEQAFVHPSSGLGLALAIRCDEPLKGMLLIFTSDNPSFEVPKTLARILNTNGVVLKPVRRFDLYETLISVLRKEKR